MSCTLELSDLQTSLGLCLKHGDGKNPKVSSVLWKRSEELIGYSKYLHAAATLLTCEIRRDGLWKKQVSVIQKGS